MSSRRRIGLPLLLLLLCLLLPGWASAAPQVTDLVEYQAMLRQGIAHLQRAEERFAAKDTTQGSDEALAAISLLSGEWRLETPHGPADVDLTPLGQVIRTGIQYPRNLALARYQAEEHLVASEALAQPPALVAPGARQRLEIALAKGKARSLQQRLNDWLTGLIQRRLQGTAGAIPPVVYYAGGVLATIALLWVGFAAYRLLARQGAPGEATLHAGRERRLERPPTPAELRTISGDLARRGDYLAALRTAHLALLQHFDEVKLIRYEPAQTNREHERQLRRLHPDLARTLRSLNELTDRRLYSGFGATQADYEHADSLVAQLWREGDVASKRAEAPPGPSSSASSH